MKGGLAIVMAPTRGGSLQAFVDRATGDGRFDVSLKENYNDELTRRHAKLLGNPEYNPDVHHPLLIELVRR